MMVMVVGIDFALLMLSLALMMTRMKAAFLCVQQQVMVIDRGPVQEMENVLFIDTLTH
jgi:hypothetical protein